MWRNTTRGHYQDGKFGNLNWMVELEITGTPKGLKQVNGAQVRLTVEICPPRSAISGPTTSSVFGIETLNGERENLAVLDDDVGS